MVVVGLVETGWRAAAGERLARVVGGQRRRRRTRKEAMKGPDVKGKFVDGGPMTDADGTGGWGAVDRGFSG
jgi:hypothetical protein